MASIFPDRVLRREEVIDLPHAEYRRQEDPFIDWERLVRAKIHPTQVAILDLLTIDQGRVLSPNELAYELQIDVSLTGYHVTELVKAGFLELVDTAQRRGALEHYYRLVTDQVAPDAS